MSRQLVPQVVCLSCCFCPCRVPFYFPFMYLSVLFPASYYPAPPQWVATVSCLLALPPEFMPHSPSPRWPCVNFSSCLSSKSFVCSLILSHVVCFPARCLCASVWSGLCFYRPPCVILHFVFPLSKIMTCNKGLVLKMLHPWDLCLLFVFYFVFFVVFFSSVWNFTLYCDLECHPRLVKFYRLGR